MIKLILILNSGSSRIKFALFDAMTQSHVQLQGTLSELGGIPAFSAGNALAGQLPPLAMTHEFGLDIDDAANRTHLSTISVAQSRVAVCVIPTNEEAVIARSTAAMLRLGVERSGFGEVTPNSHSKPGR